MPISQKNCRKTYLYSIYTVHESKKGSTKHELRLYFKGRKPDGKYMVDLGWKFWQWRNKG
jgi:hypothetical protein